MLQPLPDHFADAIDRWIPVCPRFAKSRKNQSSNALLAETRGLALEFPRAMCSLALTLPSR